MSSQLKEAVAVAKSDPALDETREGRAPGWRWRSLGRTLREVAIVTAGILIAFALDAWWDNRVTAEREQIHLRALVSDFEHNVGALQAIVSKEEDVMANTEALLKLARTSSQDAPASLVELMNGVFNSGRYEPVMGAYEALLNSGGLMLIRDESLRAALAEFAASVRNEYSDRWSQEHYFAFAREFGAAYTLHTWERQNGGVAEEGLPEAMISNPRFREHLAMRYYSERDMANRYRTLLQQAESVLSQLREQIET